MRIKLHYQSLINSSFYLACFLLLLTVGLIIFPCTSFSASASISDTPDSANVASTTRVYSKSAISIAIQADLDIDVVPIETGSFSSAVSNLRISTNNRSGYSVYLRSSGHDSKLISEDPTVTDAINPLPASVTEAYFDNNTWGYTVDNISELAHQYHPVPVTDTSIFTTDSAANADHYDLRFGVKIDQSLPAGIYSNSVIISAVTNPMTITSLTGLIYMQDMNSDICAATPEHATKQLIDSRDGKSYWVTKLKDGNCWMTQNLALDIAANADGQVSALTTTGSKTALTSLNTDVPEDWQWPYFNFNPSSDPNKLGLTSETRDKIPKISNASMTTTYSFDFGKYVLALPSQTNDCGRVTDINTCTKIGLVDVSNEANWQPIFQAKIGDWTLSDGTKVNSTYVAAECNSDAWVNNICTAGIYDPHYLLGNYYQYNTATAGSSTITNDSNASASICPNNWKLPTGNTSNGSFVSLFNQYGITSKPTTNSTILSGDLGNVVKPPLYFVRGGHISLAEGISWLLGQTVYAWSSTTSESTSMSSRAYYLAVHPTESAVGLGYDRYYPYSIRCLAR